MVLVLVEVEVEVVGGEWVGGGLELRLGGILIWVWIDGC